jgi:hypothetical protein
MCGNRVDRVQKPIHVAVPEHGREPPTTATRTFTNPMEIP